jgi:hypothetical protein
VRKRAFDPDSCPFCYGWLTFMAADTYLDDRLGYEIEIKLRPAKAGIVHLMLATA